MRTPNGIELEIGQIWRDPRKRLLEIQSFDEANSEVRMIAGQHRIVCVPITKFDSELELIIDD